MDRGAWWATVQGVSKELDKTEQQNNNCKQACSLLDYCYQLFLESGERLIIPTHRHEIDDVPP